MRAEVVPMRDEFGPVDSEGEEGASAFVTPEDIQAMQMERSVYPEESAENTMRRIFRENASEAALAIVKVMKHDPNGRTRLAAAQYMTDRILGRIGDDLGESDPIKEFMGAFVNEIEIEANR